MFGYARYAVPSITNLRSEGFELVQSKTFQIEDIFSNNILAGDSEPIPNF